MNRFAALVLAAATALSFAPTAEAGTGMFCTSARFTYRLQSGDPAKLAMGIPYATNATVYTCPNLGNYTIPQLYSLGYRVVSEDLIMPPVVIPITSTYTYANFRILIEKP